MSDLIVFDTETTGLDYQNDKIIGYSYYLPDLEQSFYVTREEDPNLSSLVSLLKDKKIVAHNGKFDLNMVYYATGELFELYFDTVLGYKQVHIDREAKLETIMQDVFNEHKKDLVEIYCDYTGKNIKSKETAYKYYWKELPTELIAQYAKEDVEGTYRLYKYLEDKMDEYFFNIEMPFCNILLKSETTGCKLNLKKLKNFEEEVAIAIKKIEKDIYFFAGGEFNINSSKQKQDVLFNKLKLPKTKKSISKKTKQVNYKTDIKALNTLAKYHIVPKLMLQYSEVNKLHTSFLVPLQEKADKNNRIHANFNQCGTDTRRMSCTNPNLQQIPSKSDLAERLRQCFIPGVGRKFLVADYSQIELRLLAHFSGDKVLMEAFESKEDLHKFTISRMRNIPLKDVDKKLRAIGKLLNFSIIYGKTSVGFAEDWGCTKEEAQNEIDSWFNVFSSVKEWCNNQENEVLMNYGWTETISGRKLFIPNSSSNNRWERASALRKSVNYPIQSSSQDILKKAVVDIYDRLNIYPILYVHDELVFELEDTRVAPEIIKIMENAWKLDVPLEVGYTISDHWEKD